LSPRLKYFYGQKRARHLAPLKVYDRLLRWFARRLQPRVDHDLPVIVQSHFRIGKQVQEGLDQFLNRGHVRLLGFVRISPKETRADDMEADQHPRLIMYRSCFGGSHLAGGAGCCRCPRVSMKSGASGKEDSEQDPEVGDWHLLAAAVALHFDACFLQRRIPRFPL
jgi:hypothetical protein